MAIRRVVKLRTALTHPECREALRAAVAHNGTFEETLPCRGGLAARRAMQLHAMLNRRESQEVPVSGWACGRLFRLSAATAPQAHQGYRARVLYGWLGKGDAVYCREIAQAHDPLCTAGVLTVWLVLLAGYSPGVWEALGILALLLGLQFLWGFAAVLSHGPERDELQDRLCEFLRQTLSAELDGTT